MQMMIALSTDRLPSVLTPPVLAGIVIILVLAVLVKLIEALKGGGGVPYVKVDSLMTAAERSFFGVLQQVVGPEQMLFAKVRLADVIKVRPGVSGKGFQAAFNRICAKHVDFVICDARTLEVLGVIELDDRSHGHAKRQERDSFMDAALAAASIPVLRVPAKKGYVLTELRTQVQGMVSRGEVRCPAGAPT